MEGGWGGCLVWLQVSLSLPLSPSMLQHSQMLLLSGTVILGCWMGGLESPEANGADSNVWTGSS